MDDNEKVSDSTEASERAAKYKQFEKKASKVFTGVLVAPVVLLLLAGMINAVLKPEPKPTPAPTETPAPEPTPDPAYSADFAKLLSAIEQQPNVVKAESYQQGNIKVTVTGDWSKYEARKMALSVQGAFLEVRRRHAPVHDFSTENVYIYNDVGDELAVANSL